MSKLQEALEEVQHTHIKEVDEMNAQLERQRDRTEELTEAVSTLVSFIFQNRLQFRYSYWIHKVCLVAETARIFGPDEDYEHSLFFLTSPLSEMRERDKFVHARDRRAASPLHARTRVHKTSLNLK